MILAAGSLALTVIFFISTLNWRRSLQAVLVLVILEGILRKWVFPQASDLIYFLKDIVLLGAYFKYYVHPGTPNHDSLKINGFKLLVSFAAIWCFAEVFNPRLGSFVPGLLGFKFYILYIPMVWMLPDLFLSEDELHNFLKIYLLSIIPVSLLSIAQFFSSPSSPINVYAGGIESSASFVQLGNVRVTGTFSYLTGYSTYLTVCFALLLPVLARKDSTFWKRAFSIELVLLIVSSFMTGSRTLILFIVLYLALYIGLLSISHVTEAGKYLLRFLAPVILIYALLNYTDLGIGFNAFKDRFTSGDDMLERITREFTGVSEYLAYSQFDGYGTGATHQAVDSLRRILNIQSGEVPPGIDGEIARILLELGPFGLLLIYSLRIYLLINLVYLAGHSKKPYLRQLAISMVLLQTILFTNQVVFNHTFAVYYWFLSGFILLFPKLEQTEACLLEPSRKELETRLQRSSIVLPMTATRPRLTLP